MAKRKTHGLIVRPSPDPLDKGLRLDWRFDQRGDHIVDYSGFNYHGKDRSAPLGPFANGATWTTGPKGIGLRNTTGSPAFTSITIEQLNIPDNWTSITIENYYLLNALSGAWPSSRGLSFQQSDVGSSTYDAGYGFVGDGGAGRTWQLVTGTALRSYAGVIAIPAVGDYLHLVMTYDGARMQGYRNGVADGAGVAATGALDDYEFGLSYLMMVGWYGDDNHDLTTFGARIYNRALSQAEIIERYRISQVRMRPQIALSSWGMVPAGAPVNIDVPVATITLTGYAPTISTPVNIDVPVATITLTGYAPTVTATANIEIDVPLATLTLTGYAPTVAVAGNIEITVPLATLTLTGYAPGVVAGLPAGRYSPGHENHIESFVEGLKVKVTIDGTSKFIGRIANIRPSAGAFDYPTVEVEVHDWLGGLADQEMGKLPVQQTKRADEALTTALTAFKFQPESFDAEVGVETFMLVFDTENPKTSMASFFQKMCRNELGRLHLGGNGVLYFKNRTYRDRKVTSDFHLDGTMTELDISYARSDTWNVIQATISPVEASPLPDVQLWDMKVAEYFGGVIPSIAPGQTLKLNCPFTDPALDVPISAMDLVDPIAVIEFGSAADFESNDMIGDLVWTQEIGAYATVVSMTNTHVANTGYVNDLQIYGRALYRYGTQVVESRNQSSVDTGIGERRFRIRLECIATAEKAKAITDLIRDRYSDPHISARRITWLANVSAGVLNYSTNLEPSTRFTVTESATGVDQDFFVNRVKYTLRGQQLWVEVLADPVRTDVPPAYIYLTGLAPAVTVS